MADRPIRIGHLAFGVAFAVIGIAWIVGDHGDVAWIAAVTGITLGVAGLVTALTRLLR